MSTELVTRLRQSARLLRDQVRAEDSDAISRVLQSHPKYVGNPPERLRPASFTLRDAQLVVARESGHDSWVDLLQATTPPSERKDRWQEEASLQFTKRVFDVARGRGHRAITLDHIFLTLLDPPQPTPAARVLASFGITKQTIEQKFSRSHDWAKADVEEGTAISTPTYHSTLGWAQGLAVALGSPTLQDEHVLIALCYGLFTGNPHITWLDLDPDEVIERLEAEGGPIPPILPQPLLPAPGPYGPRVYLPDPQLPQARRALAKQLTDEADWGFNTSHWKRGYSYIDAEDEIPLLDLLNEVLDDPSVMRGGAVGGSPPPRRTGPETAGAGREGVEVAGGDDRGMTATSRIIQAIIRFFRTPVGGSWRLDDAQVKRRQANRIGQGEGGM